MPRNNAVVIPENILQNLKCVKCSLYISVAPVSYDVNENLVCGRCHEHEPNSPLRRAKAFETILELLLFPCRYSDNGCAKVLKTTQITSHEDTCEYGPLKCPMVISGKCDWQGNSNLLYEHCLERHAVSSKLKTFFYVNNGVDIFFMKISTYLFVVNFFIDKTIKKTIEVSVHQIIKNNEQECFEKYQIRFTRGFKRNLTLIIHNSLYDYNITRFKEKERFPVAINFFKINEIGLFEYLNFQIDICNLSDNAIALRNLKNFECPRCSLVMKTNIIVCSGGHNFCYACFKTSNICPTCNKKCDGTKNLILQNIAENTRFPCENEDQGCKYLGIKNDLERHELNCLYEKIVCPLKKIAQCVWNGSAKNHINHFKTHQYETLISGEEYKHLILDEDTELYWILCFDNSYFRCYFQESIENASFTWSFHQIGISKNSKPSYKIEMEFINEDIKASSLIVGFPCYRFRNAYSEDSITIPYHCLSRYYASTEGCGHKLQIRYNVIKLDDF